MENMEEIKLERGLKLHEIKKEMVKLLQSFGIEKGEASVESELMVEHVSTMNRAQQLVCSDLPLTDKQIEQLEVHLGQRQKRMPIQYCLETTEFCGLKFKIRSGVFIPRCDTESLVEHSLSLLKNLDEKEAIKVLEVGVGSGCISISLLKKNPKILATATDISEEALSLTLENAELHQVFPRLSLKNEGLWWLLDEKFDLIVSNPPYIPLDQKSDLEPEVVEFEPHEALFGRDPDGLRFYRKLSTTAMDLFGSTGGYIALEVGDGQAQKVKEIFEEAGWKKLQIEKDINGNFRVVSGFWQK